MRISILGASMPVMQTLAAIGRFIRGAPPPPAHLLEAYVHEVIPVLDRAEWLYEYWLEQSTLFTDSEKLGNVAAIHRWETAAMGRSLARVIPPSVLADAHERVIDALEMASRAAQLLSNGSRFHNANAVCEGHAMLTVSRERRLAALRSMRRYLARVQPVSAREVDAAAPPTPAEAPALATLSDDPSPRDLPPVDPSADGSPPINPTSDGASPHTEPIPDPAATSAEPVPAAPPDASLGLPDDPSPPETAAPEPKPQTSDPAAEPTSRAGWGSLFGSPPDQSGR
jgi:hypothetical protein